MNFISFYYPFSALTRKNPLTLCVPTKVGNTFLWLYAFVHRTPKLVITHLARSVRLTKDEVIEIWPHKREKKGKNPEKPEIISAIGVT